MIQLAPTSSATTGSGRLLKDPPPANVICASINDAAAVAAAVVAGAGGAVTIDAGGKIDSGPAGPARLTGTVRSILRDDPVGGDIAVIDVVTTMPATADTGANSTGTATTGAASSARISAIITSRRKPYHVISDFERLGLDVHATDIVIVKIGYLEPELYDAAADWRLALTPGGVDQDLLRLGHRNLGGPVFPFEDPVNEPDLTPWLRPR